MFSSNLNTEVIRITNNPIPWHNFFPSITEKKLLDQIYYLVTEAKIPTDLNTRSRILFYNYSKWQKNELDKAQNQKIQNAIQKQL